METTPTTLHNAAQYIHQHTHHRTFYGHMNQEPCCLEGAIAATTEHPQNGNILRIQHPQLKTTLNRHLENYFPHWHTTPPAKQYITRGGPPNWPSIWAFNAKLVYTSEAVTFLNDAADWLKQTQQETL